MRRVGKGASRRAHQFCLVNSSFTIVPAKSRDPEPQAVVVARKLATSFFTHPLPVVMGPGSARAALVRDDKVLFSDSIFKRPMTPLSPPAKAGDPVTRGVHCEPTADGPGDWMPLRGA